MKNNLEVIERLQEGLKGPKPGLPAQLTMVPHPRPGQKIYTEVEDSCLKAGVMLLLYPKAHAFYLALTRRAGTVLHHRGQIGLPGGQLELKENFEEAAVRETWEELGIPPAQIKIIGCLTPLYIPPSDFCIYPVVAVAAGSIIFKPLPEEVAEVIELPLRHLMDPQNTRRETWTLEGRPVEVPFYEYREHKIWGATAMVLAEFLAVLQSNQKT
jgi:8-oxo-dGTP pyrophosphatase MutT (NUDIX family)